MKERVKVFGGTSTTRSGITTGTERVHYILLLPAIYYLDHMHKSCQSEEISCSSLLWTALSCTASCRVRCGASFFFRLETVVAGACRCSSEFPSSTFFWFERTSFDKFDMINAHVICSDSSELPFFPSFIIPPNLPHGVAASIALSFLGFLFKMWRNRRGSPSPTCEKIGCGKRCTATTVTYPFPRNGFLGWNRLYAK